MAQLFPKKKRRREIPAVSEMIREAQARNFIDEHLKKELLKFINIRNNLEHAKTQLQLFMLDWTYEGGDSSVLFSKKIETPKDFRKLFPNPFELAKKGLTLYFRLSASILKKIRSSP